MMAAPVLHTVPVERLRDAEARLAAALARIEELEEEVRQLRAHHFGDEGSTPRPDCLRLTPIKRALFACLWHRRGRVWSRDNLMRALYREVDEPGIKTLDVHICQMRRKLAPHGVVIETVWGFGFRLAKWPREWEGGDGR